MTDRKKSLREFQARLSERLRQAASGTASTARLGVQVGTMRLLVELSEAGEVLPVPSMLARMPLARDWFRGLVNLRGSLHAVSDLARFADGEVTPPGKDSRLIAFAPRLGLNAAILVARMLGLQNVEAMSRADGASDDASKRANAAERPGWLGADWVDTEGRHWTELSLSRLAADSRFLEVRR